jgi:hypothetical protein
MIKNQVISSMWKELAIFLSEGVLCENLGRGSQQILKKIRSSFPDGQWRYLVWWGALVQTSYHAVGAARFTWEVQQQPWINSECVMKFRQPSFFIVTVNRMYYWSTVRDAEIKSGVNKKERDHPMLSVFVFFSQRPYRKCTMGESHSLGSFTHHLQRFILNVHGSWAIKIVRRI